MAQLPGKSAGWTAFCLRLGNRDISQAGVPGKKPEHQTFKPSGLDGSCGNEDLMGMRVSGSSF